MIEATLSAALLASALLPGSTHPAASDLDALFPPATKAMVVTSGPESEKFTYYDSSGSTRRRRTRRSR